MGPWLFGNAAMAADYVIHNRMEILKPIKLSAMNNDSQDAVLVEDKGETAIVDITYHPLVGDQVVQENPNWQSDDKAMPEYLKPGLTSNWDLQMQKDLIAALAMAGIDPNKLTDKQLVQQVSNWLLKNFNAEGPFIAYYVDFKNGQPYVRDEFRKEFEQEKSSFGLTTDQQAFDHGLFGKAMFYNRIHGSCTPSSILWTTVFRALGIPTRIVETTPPVDANDSSQLKNIVNAVGDNVVRSTLVTGVGVGAGGWANHTFVEVFVGKKWVRLNYNKLGQAILDPYYFGMLTIVNHFKDWSDSGLVDTWGLHAVSVMDGKSFPVNLGSVNPYRSLGLSDNLNQLAGFPNPPGRLNFPLTATVNQMWTQNDPTLPPLLQQMSVPGYTLIFAEMSERDKNGNYTWLKFLLKILSPEFIFTNGADQQKLSTQYVGTYSSDTNQGFILIIPSSDYQKLKLGASYSVSVSAPSDANFGVSILSGVVAKIY